MLRRRNQVVLYLGEATISVWQKPPGLSAWDLSFAVPIACSDDPHSYGQNILAAFQQALKLIQNKSATAGCTIMLCPKLAPGLIVQLGNKAVSYALRMQLASHCMTEVFSTRPRDWIVKLDRSCVTGPALAFALESVILDGIRAAFASSKLQLSCIEPAVVWASGKINGQLDDGWLGFDDGKNVALARTEQGIATFLENRAGPSPETLSDCVHLLRRTMFRQGDQSSNARLHWICLEDRLSGSATINGVSIQVSKAFPKSALKQSRVQIAPQTESIPQ